MFEFLAVLYRLLLISSFITPFNVENFSPSRKQISSKDIHVPKPRERPSIEEAPLFIRARSNPFGFPPRKVATNAEPPRPSKPRVNAVSPLPSGQKADTAFTLPPGQRMDLITSTPTTKNTDAVDSQSSLRLLESSRSYEPKSKLTDKPAKSLETRKGKGHDVKIKTQNNVKRLEVYVLIVALDGKFSSFERIINRSLSSIPNNFIITDSMNRRYNVSVSPLFFILPDSARFSTIALENMCRDLEGRLLVSALIFGGDTAAFTVSMGAATNNIPVLWARGAQSNPPGTQDDQNPMMIHLEPDENEIWEAIRGLLLATQWHDFTMMVTPSLTARSATYLDVPPLNPRVVSIMQNPQRVYEILTEISSSTRGVILLLCDLPEAIQVTGYAKRMNMFDGHFIWIWIDTALLVPSTSDQDSAEGGTRSENNESGCSYQSDRPHIRSSATADPENKERSEASNQNAKEAEKREAKPIFKSKAFRLRALEQRLRKQQMLNKIPENEKDEAESSKQNEQNKDNVASDSGAKTESKSDTGTQTENKSDTGTQTENKSDTGTQTKNRSDTGTQTKNRSDTGTQTKNWSDDSAKTQDKSDNDAKTQDKSDNDAKTQDKSDNDAKTQDKSDSNDNTKNDENGNENNNSGGSNRKQIRIRIRRTDETETINPPTFDPPTFESRANTRSFGTEMNYDSSNTDDISLLMGSFSESDSEEEDEDEDEDEEGEEDEDDEEGKYHTLTAHVRMSRTWGSVFEHFPWHFIYEEKEDKSKSKDTDLPLGLLSVKLRPLKLDRRLFKGSIRLLVSSLQSILKKYADKLDILDSDSSCWKSPSPSFRNFSKAYAGEIRKAVRDALSSQSQSQNRNRADRALTANFQILNLVPERFHMGTAQDEPLHWRQVGQIEGRQAQFNAVIWPGGDLTTSTDSTEAKTVYRIVTGIAPPFVVETALNETGNCFEAIICHRVLNSDKENLTLLFDEMDMHKIMEKKIKELGGNNQTNNPFQFLNTLYSDIRNNDTRYNSSCCSGISMDLLENVADELGLHFHLYLIPGNIFGFEIQSEEGGVIRSKWIGIIGDLISGAAHMSFGPLSISKVRQAVVDFSTSYFSSGVSSMGLKPEMKVEQSSFIFAIPFTAETWFAIFTCVNVSAVGAIVYEWLSPRGMNPRGRRRTWNFNLNSWLRILWSRLSGRPVDLRHPLNRTYRILINIWGGFSVIFIVCYIANIVFLLARSYLRDSPKNESLGNGPLLVRRVGTVFWSSSEQYMRQINTNLWQHVRNFSFNDIESGIVLLKNGTIDIVLGDTPILDYYIANDKDCKLRRILKTLKEDSYAVGMNKGFPLKENISAVISKYYNNGYIDILKDKWYGDLPCFRMIPENYVKKPRSFGAASISVAYIFLTVGMSIGAVVLIIENIYYRLLLPCWRNRSRGPMWRSRNLKRCSQNLHRIIHSENADLSSPQVAEEDANNLEEDEIASSYQGGNIDESEGCSSWRYRPAIPEIIREIERVRPGTRQRIDGIPTISESIKTPIRDEDLEVLSDSVSLVDLHGTNVIISPRLVQVPMAQSTASPLGPLDSENSFLSLDDYSFDNISRRADKNDSDSRQSGSSSRNFSGRSERNSDNILRYFRQPRSNNTPQKSEQNDSENTSDQPSPPTSSSCCGFSTGLSTQEATSNNNPRRGIFTLLKFPKPNRGRTLSGLDLQILSQDPQKLRERRYENKPEEKMTLKETRMKLMSKIGKRLSDDAESSAQSPLELLMRRRSKPNVMQSQARALSVSENALDDISESTLDLRYPCHLDQRQHAADDRESPSTSEGPSTSSKSRKSVIFEFCKVRPSKTEASTSFSEEEAKVTGLAFNANTTSTSMTPTSCSDKATGTDLGFNTRTASTSMTPTSCSDEATGPDLAFNLRNLQNPGREVPTGWEIANIPPGSWRNSVQSDRAEAAGFETRNFPTTAPMMFYPERADASGNLNIPQAVRPRRKLPIPPVSSAMDWRCEDCFRISKVLGLQMHGSDETDGNTARPPRPPRTPPRTPRRRSPTRDHSPSRNLEEEQLEFSRMHIDPDARYRQAERPNEGSVSYVALDHRRNLRDEFMTQRVSRVSQASSDNVITSRYSRRACSLERDYFETYHRNRSEIKEADDRKRRAHSSNRARDRQNTEPRREQHSTAHERQDPRQCTSQEEKNPPFSRRY